ncbi:LOW QUALITY PROTEIN: centlein [Sphaeramia orbicularis]|uniref:LOW QUALITY PROTEIN: centlein n=1 Tax=Sphaeramia orbicularis TaxID=375764 RepID=UPI00117D8781|nr:LOW QUALITY PROTEIN: centlein [Sphaeramia orbicularis]
MSSKDNSRILLLEDQVKSLSDELMQCQADKEFVWSLWKRLQVANPDLTQAVSLVVEREKHKAETKDRKVLEILQSKDYRIQELEQTVTGQQQEINHLAQRRTTVDEESTLMKKELAALHEQLLNKTQELKEMKTECRRKKEEEQQVVQAIEEKKEGLMSRCAALQADLEEKERQVNTQREQRDAAQARVKGLEEELHSTWKELSNLQSHSSSLAAQLSSKERQVTVMEVQLSQLRHEFAEVQTLYKQSTEHAAEQSHLIKQLEGLNLDTQRVLKNQEEAHTADTSSYQRLYKELSQCYQALVSSEAKLRQSHQELSSQVVQKDQHILQLQAQLEQQQQLLQEQQTQIQQTQQTTTHFPSPNRQTNFKAVVSEPTDAAAQRSSPSFDQASTYGSDPKTEEGTLKHHSTRSVRRQQGAPMQQSRSLSPASSVEMGCGRTRITEKRIQDLEELLELKIQENEELRRAHDKRRERLCLIQSNYRTIKDQLKEMEKSNGLPVGRMQRAEPWQLRQENSDAVWNELAYLKNLNRKMTTEKVSLEEELDMLRVQAAMDRATVKELHVCLANEHQELLHKVVKRPRVKSSTPKKPSVSSERMEESFKKIEQLERRMMSLEEETEKLREEKEKLLEANEDLAYNCCKLQTSLDHLRTQEAFRSEAAQAQALAQGERHRSEIMALEDRLVASQKQATELHHKLLKLRQELGILRAARDFYRNRAAGPSRAGGIANNISSKVKFKTAKRRGPIHLRSHRTVSPNQAISWQRRSPSPSKDEWEDMSADSDSSEEYSDSLNGCTFKDCHSQKPSKEKVLQVCTDFKHRKHHQKQNLPESNLMFWPKTINSMSSEHGKRGEEKRWRRKKMLTKTQHCSSSSLQQRIESLQRHIDILRSARKDAVLSARELQRANEKMTAQLNSLTEKLCSSKQLTQKLTSDLAGVEQQKKVLELELEQWRRITFPQQTVPVPTTAPVNTECSSCQGRTVPTPADPAPQVLEAEVKQLQAKLKSASAEVTRQVASNKALRGQLQEKEDKLRQLHDKTTHVERDVNMKRQLVEDLKTRLKFLQEMEKSYRGQVEELEKKVKTLAEEATNRKALIESLKRRLNVATTEKSQLETSCAKLKEDLEKKEQRIHALQTRLGASEQALAALEQTATEQMEGLTQQSSHALDRVQRQLGQAHSQLEQLYAFVQALASEILLDVHEVKQQLMKKRRLRQASAVAAKGGLSAKSMIKAKSIAASILNMSENDLADIMDTDQRTKAHSEGRRDQEWLDHFNHILQQKIPSAGQLMEAVRVKMKERKVLTEELATLATPVSEKS